MRKPILIVISLLQLAIGTAWAADPDALWKIINGTCEPCVAKRQDYVVMKDHHGIAQYLVLPTARIAGMESPEILDPNAPNYWAAAWAAKSWVDAKLPQPLARDRTVLAINSAYGRTQNQLHIHVDCLAAEVHQTLALDSSAIGPNWSALPHGLKGHPYWARRLISEDLVDANPFLLLADAVPDARAHMGQYTLVVVGARFEDGQNGFILLTDRADLVTADRASGEEVQDHDCRP